MPLPGAQIPCKSNNKTGHTKFSPDWGFGLLKQKYKKTFVGCLDDIVKVINQSAKPNWAQLVGAQDGSNIVPMYNWADYFNPHTVKTALKGITQMHHFRFSSAHLGKVFVKNCKSDKERSINLRKESSWNPTPTDLPHVIVPDGLSLERRWYLFDKVREFCPVEVLDLVCPKPTEPRP